MNADQDSQEQGPDLHLVELSAEMREAFLEYCREIRDAGEPFHGEHLRQAEENWKAFIRQRLGYACGQQLPRGGVRQNDYCLMRKGRILGLCRLRHKLNRPLRRRGGHIGYDVRPSERGKGHATRMLGLTLEKARELRLRRVLLTCDKTNAASARVIQKCGGVLEDESFHPRTGELLQRYWIRL